jgi:chorismate synthase
MKLSEEDLLPQLQRRRPGQSDLTTPRNEKDRPTILSGVENGVTLRTPIAVAVNNNDTRPDDYQFDPETYLLRPSHADYTYHRKYGIHAKSGGGRSSARETIARVIAGSVAEKCLQQLTRIEIVAYVSSIGPITFVPKEESRFHATVTREQVDQFLTRCPDSSHDQAMIQHVVRLKEEGDSTGGTVTCVCRNVPPGLGEPVFDKMEAVLAHAMLSIPSTRSFELGSGRSSTEMRGSDHNDPFTCEDGRIRTITNHSGGVQGGITNGETIHFRVGFKPPSSINRPQATVNLLGEKKTLAVTGRHDPCVVYRAVPIVESMAAIVIFDLLGGPLARPQAKQ